jgi:hypothetical protein
MRLSQFFYDGALSLIEILTYFTWKEKYEKYYFMGMIIFSLMFMASSTLYGCIFKESLYLLKNGHHVYGTFKK